MVCWHRFTHSLLSSPVDDWTMSWTSVWLLETPQKTGIDAVRLNCCLIYYVHYVLLWIILSDHWLNVQQWFDPCNPGLPVGLDHTELRLVGWNQLCLELLPTLYIDCPGQVRVHGKALLNLSSPSGRTCQHVSLVALKLDHAHLYKKKRESICT